MQESDAKTLVEEFFAFVEANEDLHYCSAFHLLQRVPQHLLPAAEALIEVQFLYGTPGGEEPRGILNP